MTKEPRRYPPTEAQVRNAYRISLVMTGVWFLIATVWQVAIDKPITLLSTDSLAAYIGMASLVSTWLNRRGRSALGVWLILGTLCFTVLAVAFQAGGRGAIMGAVVLVLTFGIGSVTLPPRQANIANFVGIATALVVVVMDIVAPVGRESSSTTTLGLVLGGVLVLVFTIFILRQFRNYALRTKLTIVLILVTALATGAVATFTQRATTQALTESVGEELKNIADARALAIGDLLDRQFDSLKTLALNEVLQQAAQTHNASYSGDAAAIQAELEQRDQQWRAAEDDNDPLIWEHLNNEVALDLLEYRRAFPDHVEILITDRYGALLAATNRTTGYYQADEAWWQAAFDDGQGDSYISTPVFDESTGEAGLIIALPLLDRDTGELVGILRTTYLLTTLKKSLMSTRMGETGIIDVIIPGETVQHVREGEFAPIDPEFYNQLQAASGETYTEVIRDDVLGLASQSPVKTLAGEPAIDDLGWVAVLYQHKAEALKPVEVQARGALLVALVITGLASAIAAWLAQVLVTPIARLTVVAQDVAGGDLTARATVGSQDEIGALAAAFNSMTTQLNDLIGTLEQRVADRTRALAASTEVSRRLSTILDQSQLVASVVDEVQTAFDYYHAHIYLFDEAKENLIMVGGTGEAGRIMLERRHRIRRGKGLVGRAAKTNEVVLVPDVSQTIGWLPNELLPDTKAEVAVPIAIGPDVLGVLDVQENTVGGLTEEDAALLRSIAGQVAIAVQNAQLYARTQQQAERESLINLIGQKIQRAATIEDVLKVAVSELGQALGAQRSSVQLSLRSGTDGQN